ncbi:hypothetical protein [Methylorubrum salsuginis]|uniref:hypothetical protein n=1 Tax=Methylorubrum salsuginis TaxID=414703 RepID=UPI000B84A71F|nr:hypothetical protein [Methylorubrum salsuginis]
MNATAAYFREKADLFRGLADLLDGQDDRIVAQLRTMADDFDAHADTLERQVVREAAHLSHDEEVPQLH